MVLRFGYYCGWREGEIFRLTWADNYDEAGQIIRLNDSKNGDGRVLTLRDGHRSLTECGQIIELAKQNRVKNCPLIFHFNGRPINRSTFNKHWHMACEASGVNHHFHDLRRTAVRNLTRAGVHRTIAKAVTGHESDDVFERYDIVDEADIREALSKMHSYLDGRKPNNVQPTAQRTEPPASEQSEVAATDDKAETSVQVAPTRTASSKPDEVFGLMADLGVV